MSSNKHIIIVGCGRLGGMLAGSLSKAGHNVVVIDRREASFDKLGADFSGFRVLADATELHVLEDAEVAKADFVFATTTSDNTNLMIAQIAQMHFKVPKVIARVFDPEREALYRDLGIETISPTKLAANAFMETLVTNFWDRIES